MLWGAPAGAAVRAEIPALIHVPMDAPTPAQKNVAAAEKHVPVRVPRHVAGLPYEEIYYDEVYVENAKTHKPWMGVLNDGYHDGMESDKYTLSWAPEINTHTPDVTDRKKGKS